MMTVVPATLLLACACGTSTPTAEQAVQTQPAPTTVPAIVGFDGPLVRHAGPLENDGGMMAEIGGTLILEGDCMYLDEAGERYPVVWPATTEWNELRSSVELPNGESVSVGDQVAGGGGYLKISRVEAIAGPEAVELINRCIDNTWDEVAVVNNDLNGISPRN